MIPVIIAGTIALIGSGAAYFFWDDIFDSSENKQRLAGKKMAVLGARGVGKTTLYHFLQHSSLDTASKEYAQTTTKNKIDACKVDIGGIKIYLSVNYDVSGNSDMALRDWIEQIEGADYILYMADADKLLCKDDKSHHKANVSKDMRNISEYVRSASGKASGKIVFFIINQCDKVKEYHEDLKKFEEKIQQLSVVQETQLRLGGSDECRIILGSLADNTEAKKLVEQIFN